MHLLCLLKHGFIWSVAKLWCKYKCIYFTLLLTFIIKYGYSSFANTYFSFLSWQDYENAFINVQGSSLEHIRERLATIIISEVLSPRGEFHY
jgi:hypothetical protein